MNFKNIFTIVSTASLMWSCGGNTENENVDNFDVSTILVNTADNLIIPQFGDLKASTIELETAFNDFEANPDASTLLNLQSKFKTSYSYWQACSFVEYGNTNLNSLSAALNTYPTDTANINSTFSNSIANLESASYTDAIGFPGLDYVLFKGTESEIISRLSNEGNDYCSKNIALIKSKIESAYSFWNDNNDSFYSDFISDKSKATGSGMSDFVNGFVKNVEVLKNGQLGFPAGKFTLNTPRPEQSEALYSGFSLDLFKAHLANLERVYKGENFSGSDGIGLDDYLKELGTLRNGKNLNELILQTFEEIETLANTLNGTTNDAIANQTTITDELYVKTKELVAYLKVDMINAMGLLIAYEDNDGD